MMKILLTFVFIFLFISCNSKKTSPTEPDEPEVQLSFTKSIERIAANDYQQSLILKAEAIYPERDSILVYTSTSFQQFIPDSNAWFWSSFDGVLIPFAITAASISYYCDLIDSLNANSGYDFFITANFEYRSKIDFKETYTFEGRDLYSNEPLPSVSYVKVYVVEMSLKWENYCGSLCGLWISHKRVIVFDESGNLLNVFYDGIIPVAVS